MAGTGKLGVENLTHQLKKSKTLRVSIKKCLRASSSTTVFLYSLIEALFAEKNTKLFRNVRWSNVAKSEEFQKWTENFIEASIKFREQQIEEFSKLKDVLSKNLRKDAKFTQDDMIQLEKNVVNRSTDPNEVVNSLRNLADSISELEGITNDDFNMKRMQRKLTNLHSRIEDLQSKLPV